MEQTSPKHLQRNLLIKADFSVEKLDESIVFLAEKEKHYIITEKIGVTEKE